MHRRHCLTSWSFLRLTSAQGGLPNQPFLGALAALAVRQGLLLDLIVSDDHSNQGAYTFQFYKHGCWHEVREG